MQRRQQKTSMIMTVVFFIIGLSVIASYEWGAAIPQFRPDAPNIILFGTLVAAIVYVAMRNAGWTQLQSRQCTSCGRSIPFDALFCPYCGFQFPRP